MKKIVGMDVGGTNIKAGIVDGDSVTHTVSRPTEADKGKEVVIANLIGAVEDLLAVAKLERTDIEGIGIGFPSQISKDRRIPLAPPNLRCLRDVPVAEVVADHFTWPGAIENDANAAALGEWLYGAGRGSNDLIILTLGTGVGGGVISGGQLLRGATNTGGELGHILVAPEGRVCGCGRRGCLEAQVSISGLLGRAKVLCPEMVLNPHDGPPLLAVAARAKRPGAMQVFEEMGRYLAMGIADLLNIFAPDLIVLSGGLSRSFDLFEPSLRAALRDQCRFDVPREHVKIVTSQLGEHAPILGAAAAFRDRNREETSRYVVRVGHPSATGLVLSIQIGVTRTQAALVNGRGEFVGQRVSEEHLAPVADRGHEDIFAEALAVGNEALRLAGRQRISAVSVIVPAGVRRDTGRIHTAPAIPGITERYLPETFRCLGVPVYIENDANSALLFEYRLGRAADLRSVLGIHLVSGVGGALIVDDRLVTGRNGHAIEIGHTPLPKGLAWECPCGSKDCFEHFASGSALRSAWEKHCDETGARRLQHNGDYHDILSAARAGDPAAKPLMEQFARDLADGLVPILNTFDPIALVFTGTLSCAADLFLKHVRDTLRVICFADIGKDADLRVASDPAYGELRGGVVVAAGEPIDWSLRHV